MYWASEPISKNPTDRINNVEYLFERDYHPNVGNAVLGTSYAMLCTLARNHVARAVPIMKFLADQHNRLMGWSSTLVSPKYMHS